MSGLEGWRIGALRNYPADASRVLEVHYAPDIKWDAQEPKKISVEWEIIYGKQSLLDNFPAKWLRKNELAKNNQFADRDDFNQVNGKFSFDNSTPTPRTGYIRLPFSENDLDYRELFGIRLKNPSPGTIIDPGYDEFSGGLQLRYIEADSNSNLKVRAIPKGGANAIEEGERIEFYIESNATEEYLKDELMRSIFKFSGMTTGMTTDMTTRSSPHGVDGMYADKKDLTPNPKFIYNEGKYFHHEVIQIPIKNGSTFSLPNYKVAKDGIKEGLESLEISFNWGLGGMMQNGSQTLDLRISDKIKDASKKNDVDLQAGFQLYKPKKFKIRSIDKIKNFDPSTHTLEIYTESFGIDRSASFAAGKTNRVVKNQLSSQDYDFLYDKKKGGLYFNENGSDKGFGDGGIIAILKGAPDLTASNLEFIGSTIYAPKKYNKKSADKITNFDSSTDTLEIDTDSFSIDSSVTFAAGKNSSAIKRLAKKDFDFLYDKKKGGLYYNENGADKGFGDGGIIAILKDRPDLSTKNIDFI